MDTSANPNASNSVVAPQFTTFPYCTACNAIIVNRDSSKCHQCNSSAIEWLRLMDIASRLRSELLSTRLVSPHHTVVNL